MAQGKYSMRPTRVLSWWLVVCLVLLVLVAGAAYVYVVGFLFGPGDSRSRALSEALRMALLVVAALGGLLALLVAARAQWLRERRHRWVEMTEPERREQAERQRVHEERVSSVQQRQQEQMTKTADAEAGERQSTELVMRAVGQLGSSSPTVRIGALSMLERLAQNNTEHRQTVVDVVCGYLRLPPTPGAESSAQPYSNVRQGSDKVVRQAAQRLLIRHLSPADRRTQWRGLRLDLSGAELNDFDAHGCVLSDADFSGATFTGTTSFADCVFDSPAVFSGTRYTGTGVSFHGARFATTIAFSRVTFECPADFELVDWGGAVSFERALFDGTALFRRAKFGSTMMLTDVDFGDATSFQSAAFEGDVDLVRVIFRGPATFADATLGGHSWFEDVRASTASTHVFPPGYSEIALDQSWIQIEHTENLDEPVVYPEAPAPYAEEPYVEEPYAEEPEPVEEALEEPDDSAVPPASAQT